MKSKLCILTLVGLVAGSLATMAQTNTPAGEPPATSASITTTNDAAPPAAPEPAAPSPEAAKADAAAQPANAQAAPATSPTPTAEAPAEKSPTLVAANNAAQPANAATTAAKDAPAADATAAPATPASTNGAPQPGAVIPLIVMDDVPLTDAIKNLARQAGLNYMLDPKVAFGQVGPDGKPVPQPTISIRWENVTAEQALNALLTTYNLQLIEDPKSKIARVTVKDPAAPDPLVTRVIQLKFSSPSNMLGAIQNTLTDKRSKVVADVRTSQLVVLATEKELIDVEKLVESLDTKTKQVLIEARLLETQINPHSDKGVDWTGTLAHQHVVMGNNALPGTPPTPGGVGTPGTPGTIGGIVNAPGLIASLSKGAFFQPSMAFLNADGVGAVLSFLNTYAETKVISAPRTVTLDNEPASIEVGTMFPIVNVTAGTANTTGGSQVTYSNLTVKLDVTPRISANNYVNLKVKPTILRLGDAVTSTIANQVNSVNEFFTRQIQTTVLIPSGNTLVMGGLIDDNVHRENRKVPVLGDIPGLGFFFRWDSNNRVKDNLIVFVTPTIVQDEDYQPTKTDFLKTPVPTKDSIEADWSAWDSGKPRDWSKAKSDSKDSGKFATLPPANN
ncbi:MAG TPA: secretin N-terminal domain-containing protein [Candidatus Binatia bacterium]|jgi:type IV pilus assembly protein PilQ|nr:secretin N-terminal domain-containing protein [Candidatus Binatia bacterium]